MRGWRTVALVAALGLCVLGCGASDGRKPVYSVTGKVTYGGKPAAGATVVFHPLGADDVRPRGKVADDGSLEVTTYDAKDGAPAGDYRLSVEWWLSPGKDAPPTNRLPASLGNPQTSGLTVKIEKGQSNALKEIELKR
ncbi:MAG: hypothetical protein EBV06_02870 [Planctomycetia bacterium]|nr:hypothetical protein [Planctomycetia bacterium]